MAKTYRLSPIRRAANALMTALLKLGLGPPNTALLTVRGRKTGRPFTTPVNLVTHGGARYLVSPYGDRTWSRNARASGRVDLRRGRRVESARVEEIPPESAAAILRKYWRDNGITRQYFEVGEDPSEEDFRAILERNPRRHPVFLIVDAVQ
jgi:deazaflavin-dependent oxidoreductase (nitroreductase family)